MDATAFLSKLHKYYVKLTGPLYLGFSGSYGHYCGFTVMRSAAAKTDLPLRRGVLVRRRPRRRANYPAHKSGLSLECVISRLRDETIKHDIPSSVASSWLEPARKKAANAHIGLLVGGDRNRRLRKHTPLLYRDWTEFDAKAERWGIEVCGFSCEDLRALIAGSTHEIPTTEHLRLHQEASEFMRRGRSALALYSRLYISLLARLRWTRRRVPAG